MDTVLEVKEMFVLSDGKRIFLGPLRGDATLIKPGRWQLLVNKTKRFEVDIIGEQIMARRSAQSDYRALSSRTPIAKHELDTTRDVIELVLRS